jgi:hypothetical protein
VLMATYNRGMLEMSLPCGGLLLLLLLLFPCSLVQPHSICPIKSHAPSCLLQQCACHQAIIGVQVAHMLLTAGLQSRS